MQHAQRAADASQGAMQMAGMNGEAEVKLLRVKLNPGRVLGEAPMGTDIGAVLSDYMEGRRSDGKLSEAERETFRPERRMLATTIDGVTAPCTRVISESVEQASIGPVFRDTTLVRSRSYPSGGSLLLSLERSMKRCMCAIACCACCIPTSIRPHL